MLFVLFTHPLGRRPALRELLGHEQLLVHQRASYNAVQELRLLRASSDPSVKLAPHIVSRCGIGLRFSASQHCNEYYIWPIQLRGPASQQPAKRKKRKGNAILKITAVSTDCLVPYSVKHDNHVCTKWDEPYHSSNASARLPEQIVTAIICKHEIAPNLKQICQNGHPQGTIPALDAHIFNRQLQIRLPKKQKLCIQFCQSPQPHPVPILRLVLNGPKLLRGAP